MKVSWDALAQTQSLHDRLHLEVGSNSVLSKINVFQELVFAIRRKEREIIEER